MGMFDGFAQTLEQQAAGAVAAKMGINPAVAQAALTALMQNHALPGDTVQDSAQQTGISSDMLSQIIGHIGGDQGLGALTSALGGAITPGGEAPAGGLGGILSSLGGINGVTSMLDRDGDGNPLNDIVGMFGKAS